MFQALEIAHAKNLKEVENERCSVRPEYMMGGDRLFRNKAVQVSRN